MGHDPRAMLAGIVYSLTATRRRHKELCQGIQHGRPVMNISRRGLLIFAAILFLLLGREQARAQKQSTKMTVSYSAAGGQYINLFVAKEFGIFREARARRDVESDQQQLAGCRFVALEKRRCRHGTGRRHFRRHCQRRHRLYDFRRMHALHGVGNLGATEYQERQGSWSARRSARPIRIPSAI